MGPLRHHARSDCAGRAVDMIDLHMHSRFSDGTDTPEELIALAVEQGATAVALTDHDTVHGIGRFLAAAKEQGVRAISGVEVSTSSASNEMHMLGYCLAHEDAVLARQLDWIRSAREARNEEILHKLHKLGMHMSWQEVCRHAGDQVIGRPHFARAMVARGYVGSTKEAFSRYLARGCPAYARRRILTAQEAIEIIRGAGGVPVLAHPFVLQVNQLELSDLVKALRDMGLEGIEAYYPQHTADQTRYYVQLAKEYDLIPTGGSDYHGRATPDLRIGRGYGDLRVPNDIPDRLAERSA